MRFSVLCPVAGVAAIAGTLYTHTPTHADFSFPFLFNPFRARPKVPSLPGAPGVLLAWGNGVKVPECVRNLPSNIIHAAPGSTFSAAVSAKGEVFVYGSDLRAEKIEGIGRVVGAEVQPGLLHVLSEGGEVYSVRVKDAAAEGPRRFESPVLLRGALRGQKVSKLKCSAGHCLTLTEQKRVVGWGSNGSLQLDQNADAVDVTEPVELGRGLGVRFIDVACGGRHSVLLDEDGKIWACGDDTYGQLGRTTEPWKGNEEKRGKRLDKALVIEKLPFCQIAAGEGHTVARVLDQCVVTFGSNQWGQLGHHNFCSMAPPARIGGVDKAVSVVAGRLHTGVVENETLKCFGGNQYGQLGSGSLQPAPLPKRVKGLAGKRLHRQISAVFFGNDASAAIVTATTDEK